MPESVGIMYDGLAQRVPLHTELIMETSVHLQIVRLMTLATF
ncbi:hypothetical protein CLV98_104245 [Dyadobacter jejuensis]|uniref:Uncharacterized protein n=1 Tax=Dyadobacter jejuensis TaxID=1082580 RepID=A0A316ALC9_9BACT|nr:hypothetical protein CLV98_104245 [Dyadobacter jejuensis]